MSSNTLGKTSLPQLYKVEFSPWIRRISLLLLAIFAIAPLVIAIAPWQQNVSGAGRVVAFTPVDRPQPVEATVKGRVIDVLVSEGDPVDKDDLLVRIVDIDPQKVQLIETKLDATKRDLDFRELSVQTFTAQIGMLESARDLAIDAFRAKVDVMTQKLLSAERKRDGVKADLDFQIETEKRQAPLVPEVLAPIKLLETRAKLKNLQAKHESAIADVDAAQAGLRNANAELGKERQTANAKVEDARAKMQSESSKVQELLGKVAGLEGELRAQNQQEVRAPRAGRVFRLNVNKDSSVVKPGQVLLQIVPVTLQPAVELFMRGVDAPLIDAGRKVRLQFEGWPALQTGGWPGVAVGTFGGIVSFVDPTDSGNGRFRLVVTPDPDDAPWPGARWLRQGVRAKGWVLLKEVRLWYEMWRQLNGFPPVVALTEPGASEAKSTGGSDPEAKKK